MRLRSNYPLYRQVFIGFWRQDFFQRIKRMSTAHLKGFMVEEGEEGGGRKYLRYQKIHPWKENKDLKRLLENTGNFESYHGHGNVC